MPECNFANEVEFSYSIYRMNVSTNNNINATRNGKQFKLNRIFWKVPHTHTLCILAVWVCMCARISISCGCLNLQSTIYMHPSNKIPKLSWLQAWSLLFWPFLFVFLHVFLCGFPCHDCEIRVFMCAVHTVYVCGRFVRICCYFQVVMLTVLWCLQSTITRLKNQKIVIEQSQNHMTYITWNLSTM